MRIWTALRWTGALWFVPLVLLLGALDASTSLTLRTGYVVADYAAASYLLVLVGPLQAGFVALMFRGFPPFVDGLRSRRSGLVAIGAGWWCLLLAVPLAAVLALVTAAGLPPDRPSWAILTVVFLTVLACGCLGVSAARSLPVVVAVPVVAGLVFAWFAFPGSGTNALLRNLNSMFDGCCSPSEVPAAAMMLGSLTLVGLIVLGTASGLLPRRWASHSRIVLGTTAALVVGLAFVGGAAAAMSAEGPLHMLAVESRQTKLVCGSGDYAEVCVWSENRSRLGQALDAHSTLSAAASLLDLPPVPGATEATGEPNAIAFDAPQYASATDVAYSLAFGYAQNSVGCPDGQPTQSAVAFASLLAGLSETEVSDRVTLAAATDAREILDSPDMARSWFVAESTPASERCGDRR